jgi:hypothetical protein
LAPVSASPLIERRFQLLALEVAIATNCPILDRQLDYLVVDARQRFAISSHVRYEAILADKKYRIFEDGRELGIEHDAVAALECLYRSSYAKANEKLPPGTVFLHAACGRMDGRRFLLIGESGTGKTTLILHLARHGVSMEGDEIAVVMPAGVVALPRRFHVKSESLTDLPWLEAGVERPPFLENGHGSYVFGVSPAQLGHAWEIRCGPIDAVFYLEPNHGGQPRIEDIPRYRMVELAMSQTRLPDRRDRSWLGPLCAMLDRATAHKLVVGHLDKTAKMLVLKLSEVPKLANG